MLTSAKLKLHMVLYLRAKFQDSSMPPTSKWTPKNPLGLGLNNGNYFWWPLIFPVKKTVSWKCSIRESSVFNISFLGEFCSYLKSERIFTGKLYTTSLVKNKKLPFSQVFPLYRRQPIDFHCICNGNTGLKWAKWNSWESH